MTSILALTTTWAKFRMCFLFVPTLCWDIASGPGTTGSFLSISREQLSNFSRMFLCFEHFVLFCSYKGWRTPLKNVAEWIVPQFHGPSVLPIREISASSFADLLAAKNASGPFIARATPLLASSEGERRAKMLIVLFQTAISFRGVCCCFEKSKASDFRIHFEHRVGQEPWICRRDLHHVCESKAPVSAKKQARREKKEEKN